MSNPKVSVIMGSQTDWPTMSKAVETLEGLLIPCETQIISAHRTPERLYRFAHEVKGRGIQVIIAGASGAAHLAGMIAAMTSIPVLGVPINSTCLQGLDSLLSTVQMAAGTPVGTLAIGEAGAKNAGLLAASILALSDDELGSRLEIWRKQQTALVAAQPTR